MESGGEHSSIERYSSHLLRGELRLELLDPSEAKVLENGSIDFSDFCSEVSSEVPKKNDRARFCRKNLDHSKKIKDHSKMDTKVVQGLKNVS